MKHSDIKEIISNKDYLGKEVTVCGWVRTARDSKNMAFIELNDGTTLKHLQLVIDKAAITVDERAFHLGASLCVKGEVVEARQSLFEINVKEITVLGDCPSDYPLQKKRHTLEFLRTMPHIRVRANTFNAVFRIRSVMANIIHEYFQNRNYIYVHTPILTGSDCEGAGEVFQVTTHPFNHTYKTAEEYYSEDFFGKKAGLSVSGQLEGEVAAMAYGKIYTFGPSFRAENSNTPRHVAEFWHVEPEVAFAELSDIIEIAEDMIKYIVSEIMKKCPEEIDFFEAHFEKGLKEKLNNLINNNFEVLDYTKAIEILEKADKEFQYPVYWGCDLQTEHERYITEEVYNKPVFITNYPKEIKSFYMKQNADGKTVAATDLLVPGVGEIIGCSEREADYDKLVEAMKVRNMNMDDYCDYLDLRKYGSVPHSGFGLGFERMIMYVTGISNIRDVILYPRTTGNIR
ncbi:MAG: asparagine--tRNA ligase [Clostridia bacterium]|nr:asparagine--tRNA ligase [Oscillospiraceae bacterium]MBR4892450.1 asparagine--tRNA ligase [Clostridia bacterium]